MSKVYLGLGTNLGDKKQNMLRAIEAIKEKIGKVVSLSSFYETAPWGFDSENSFLNAAACVETAFPPLEVLHLTQDIEKAMGRSKKSVKGVYSDRVIDIDLLLYDNIVFNSPELVLPHPLMTERAFVMTPLSEIAGGLLHPVFRKTISELKQSTSGKGVF